MMRNGIKKRLGLGIFLLFLSCAAVFLMIMQTRWAGQAAEASREELKRNLMNNVTAAMRNLLDESRVILSLLTVEPEDYSSGSWTLFGKNAHFLQTNTNLFDFTGIIYLLPFAEDKPPLAFDLLLREFTPTTTPLPTPLSDFRQALQKDSWKEYMRNLLRQTYYITSITIQPSATTTGADYKRLEPAALLAVKIDLNGFYASLLAGHMEESLQGYPYKIRTRQKLYYGSPELENQPGRQPDFRFPLDYPLTQWQFIAGPPEDEQDTGPQAIPGSRHPADVRSLLQQPKSGLREEIFLAGDNGGITLEIFYPGGPLQRVLASQTLINRTASIGILGILLLSLLLLFRLYTRMQMLREKEQEFVATISHELRTPLTVIRSTSDNLSAGIVQDGARIRKYGHVIQNQAKRLTSMVENILHYSGLEGKSNGKHTNAVDVELTSFLTTLLTALLDVAEKKQARLHYKKEEFRGRIYTDPIALNLILENLLNNALHHGCNGPQEEREVKFQVRHKVPRGLTFIIEDKGPGIPLREQKKIFSPFYRGQESIRRHIPGSGLGLHLVKRIAELLGGSVSLESPYLCVAGHEHRGCRFTLSFPWEVCGE